MIEGIQTDGKYNFSSFELEDLEEIFSEEEFPEELKNKVRGLMWSDSVIFQGFHFSKLIGVASLYEIAGVARKIGSRGDLFFFSSTSVAKLKPQYSRVTVEECVNVLGLFKMNCGYVYKYNLREFTLEEIKIISDALRSKAYFSIYDTINSRKDLTFLDETSGVSSNKILAINNFIDEVNRMRDMTINEVIQNFKDDKFIKTLPNKAKDIISSVQTDHFFMIHGKDLETFFKTFINNIKLGAPIEYLIQLENSLNSLKSSQISEMSSLNFFLTNKEKKLDLYNIFLTQDKEDLTYSITVKKMKSNISIKSEILISKLNDSDIDILENLGPKNKYSENQFTPLMTLFRIVCQEI